MATEESFAPALLDLSLPPTPSAESQKGKQHLLIILIQC